MNHKMIALAAALLAASTGAQASTSATLEVTGTVTPPPCTLTLSNGGKADFGTIDTAKLSADAATKLESSQTLTLTVNCAAAAAHTISVKDNKEDSVDNNAVAVAKPGTSAKYAFGLGKSGDTNIGAYVISLSNGRSGTSDVNFIMSDDTTTWSDTTLLVPGESVQTAWKSSNGTPAAATVSTATLTIDAAIVGIDALDLSSAVNLSGHATIEVFTL